MKANSTFERCGLPRLSAKDACLGCNRSLSDPCGERVDRDEVHGRI